MLVSSSVAPLDHAAVRVAHLPPAGVLVDGYRRLRERVAEVLGRQLLDAQCLLPSFSK